MATKHINDELWNRIEALTVKANAMHGLLRPIKEAEILHLVLQRGLELLTDDDLLQLGKYRRPIGFVLRRPGEEMVKLDMADAATVLLRSGPATLCIWSRDDILREASEAVICERLPDAALLSEGDDRVRFQALLPGFWNAAHRGETAVISLRADSADYAIARITDLMCEACWVIKGSGPGGQVKTNRGNNMVIQPMVLLSAVHPVAGYLFLEVIPDSEVGYADIYQLTDRLYVGDYLVINNPEWRRRESAFDGRPWDEWVICEHLSRIDWYSNDTILRLYQRHNLSCADLQKWGENVARWEDVPMMVERDGHTISVTLRSEVAGN